MVIKAPQWFPFVVYLLVGAWTIWCGVQLIRNPIKIQRRPYFYLMIRQNMRRMRHDQRFYDQSYIYSAEDVRKIGKRAIIVGSILEVFIVAVYTLAVMSG